MDNLIETFKEGWLDEDPRVVFAVLSGIVVFIILNILLGKSKKKLKKLKRQAIDNKTVINAAIKSRYHNRDSKSRYEYSGRYRYYVNGKEKEYAAMSTCPLPDTLELYPKNSRGTKVFSEFDEEEGFGVSANAIAGIAVCIFIMYVTGYFNSL